MSTLSPSMPVDSANPPSSRQEAEAHGRLATSPEKIPTQGWRDILVRVKNEINEDNISLIAAGVAFYGLLAIFPTLAALISIYGLIADPVDVQRQLSALSGFLPQDAYSILDQQLKDLISTSNTALGFGALISLALTLWGASKGVNNLIVALNIAYEEQEKRGFFKLSALAVLLTLGGVVFIVLTLALVVALPAFLEVVGLKKETEILVSLVRWPLLVALVMAALAVIYRYGPSRDKARWQWVSWGAGVATVLWLIASGLFSFYVSNFGDYNETYGSVGAVVILLMWFYISAYVVLLGAELNAEIEHQTMVDSTVGEPEPMGSRGARMADTIGKTAAEIKGG